MSATLIGAELFLRAQREANKLPTDDQAVQLREAGIDPAAAIREAAIVSLQTGRCGVCRTRSWSSGRRSRRSEP